MQGMTVPEIVVALKKAYTKVLRDPIIDVDLVDFQRPFFIAGGQVGKPGQYELRHERRCRRLLRWREESLPAARPRYFSIIRPLLA